MTIPNPNMKHCCSNHGIDCGTDDNNGNNLYCCKKCPFRAKLEKQDESKMYDGRTFSFSGTTPKPTESMEQEKKVYILKKDCHNIGKEIGDYYNHEYRESVEELLKKGVIEEEINEYQPVESMEQEWEKELKEFFVTTDWPSAGIKEYDLPQYEKVLAFIHKVRQEAVEEYKESIADREELLWSEGVKEGKRQIERMNLEELKIILIEAEAEFATACKTRPSSGAGSDKSDITLKYYEKAKKLLASKLSQHDTELVERLKEKKYKYKHTHDIQIGFREDGQYSCGFCGKTLDEIYPDGWPKKYVKSECPYFKAYNKAVDHLLSLITENGEGKK